MMKFKNLVLATALIIGGVSANAVANTVMVSIEQEAPAVQIATFPVGNSEAFVTADQSQDANIPFIRPAALPEPGSWNMMLLGFAGLGFVGFTGKSRSRRDLIPSFAAIKI